MGYKTCLPKSATKSRLLLAMVLMTGFQPIMCLDLSYYAARLGITRTPTRKELLMLGAGVLFTAAAMYFWKQRNKGGTASGQPSSLLPKSPKARVREPKTKYVVDPRIQHALQSIKTSIMRIQQAEKTIELMIAEAELENSVTTILQAKQKIIVREKTKAALKEIKVQRLHDRIMNKTIRRTKVEAENVVNNDYVADVTKDIETIIAQIQQEAKQIEAMAQASLLELPSSNLSR